MAPVVHGLEQEWSDQIRFAYLDIDDPQTEPFRRQLGFRYQPHFFLLDGEGAVVAEWLGPVSPEAFEEAFRFVTP